MKTMLLAAHHNIENSPQYLNYPRQRRRFQIKKEKAYKVYSKLIDLRKWISW